MPEIRLPVEQIIVADLAGKHLLSNEISDEFCVHEILHIANWGIYLYLMLDSHVPVFSHFLSVAKGGCMQFSWSF